MIALLFAHLALAQAPADVGAAPANAAPAPATEAPAAAPATEAPADPTAGAADAAPSDAPKAEADALAIDPAEIVGPPAGPPLSGEALRAKTHDIAKLMRCPVCQGLSVADSRTESALAMKGEVENLVARGYDAEQVLLYFEASYGEFIRLEPKFEGVNVLVWAAPVLLLVGGLGFVARSVRGKKPAAAPSSATPAATAPAAPTSATADATRSPETPAPVSPNTGAPPADAPGADPALAAYLRKVREETR